MDTQKENAIRNLCSIYVFEALIKIDYDQSEPEKEGAQQSETLGVNFTLTLQCSRPSVLYVDYPLVINNTLVPEEVIHVDTTYQHVLCSNLW